MPVSGVMSRAISHNNGAIVPTTVSYERLGRRIPAEMMESLKMFSDDAKRNGELVVKEADGTYKLEDISGEWGNKYARHPNLYTHGPNFNHVHVQVADGSESIYVDMLTGEFEMTKPWYRRIDTLLQNMQKVVDKFRAELVTPPTNSIGRNQALLTDEFSKGHA